MKSTAAFLLAMMIAGCAVSPPDDTVTYRPGVGVVQDVRAARVALPKAGSGAIAGSEAAGGRYGLPVERVLQPRWVEGYQLTLRMDDGSIQRVTQDSAAFQPGERVQVMADGRIVKATAAAPAPQTTTPAPIASTPLPAPPTPASRSYRPGIGIIESATVVSLSSSMSSASGGASGPTIAYRLKMLDGTTQDVVQTGPRFNRGDRVQLTRQGRLELP
jgi:hypothetical protein